ncbi:MAG: glycosyltransferase family 2 protein [Pseudoflavonifractor sp.]|nr:glycosyltransferase family 2 protein [Pseudoflavonifractor sp.]
MRKVTIMIPCYNEQDSLPILYDELCRLMDSSDEYIWEVLFINDGSRDNTLEIIRNLRLKDPRISYVSLSRNFGKEKAMLAGFDFATGDCVIIMDADLQDPPSLIWEMLDKWNEGYDDVYAKRRSRGEESWLRRKLSLAFYRILQKSTDIDILENVGDFRLLDRKCIEALKRIRESERYTKGLFCYIGYNKCSIEFDRGDRVAGKSSWNFWKLFGLAIEGLVSFTTLPLRLASIMGAIVSLISFILMAFYFIKAVIWGDSVTGFPTLIVAIFFIGGVQLICLGVIGEYISRIFMESKHRPIYIPQEYNGNQILIQ